MSDKEKIQDLERKILVAKNWMRQEVAEKKDLIKKSQSINQKSISKKIYQFFPELGIINTPPSILENLLNSELEFIFLEENPNLDGISVIIGYQKIFDLLIETLITKGYRKFTIGKKIQLKLNDPLEKTLHLVVTKGYSLGIGRLFGLIQKVNTHNLEGDFINSFAEYGEKNTFLKDFLFSEDIYKKFEILIESEIFGRKRHNGKISIEEVRKARKILLGDFVDKNCIFYMLINMFSTF